MALQAAQVTVGTTAVELTTTPTDNVAGSSILIQAPASAVLYIGDATVTADSGFPVAAGQTVSGDLNSGERVFGVLATGTATAFVLRSGI